MRQVFANLGWKLSSFLRSSSCFSSSLVSYYFSSFSVPHFLFCIIIYESDYSLVGRLKLESCSFCASLCKVQCRIADE